MIASVTSGNLAARPRNSWIDGENFKINPAKTTDTTETSLMRMFSDGPDVSLNGSPTVSPTTPALWASEPLPPCLPVSMYFLALSQAPPAFDMKIAMPKPQTSVPQMSPMTPGTPRIRPTKIGTATARTEGMIISLSAESVEMATQFSVVRVFVAVDCCFVWPFEWVLRCHHQIRRLL